MAWNKLPYVKATPALALPRLLGGTQDINIWDVMGGQFNFSTSVIEYNGLRFGEVLYVPTDMGSMYAPNILSVTGVDKDNYYVGALSEMHSMTSSFDPSKEIFMVLLEWHAPELGPTVMKAVFFCSALDTGGGNGDIDDTMEGLYNLKGVGVTPVIDKIHGIFKVADPVGANTANMPMSYFYERFNPAQGTWVNNFGGTAGFGIDIFDYPDVNLKWKTSHGIADGSDSFSEASTSHGSADILVDEEWTAEFDYDLTNCVSSTNWDEVSNPDIPTGFFSPLALLSRQIGVAIMANNNGTYRGVPIAWTDGPAGSVETFQGTGRIKINHDGLQNYDFYVSYDHGVTWTALWLGVVGDKLEIPGYQSAEKCTSFRGAAIITADTLNVRWTGIDLRTYSVLPAFTPLQSGIYPVDIQGYLADKLGFTDGVNNYIGFNGSDDSFEGSNTGSVITGPETVFDEVRYNGQAGYRLDIGGNVFHFTGDEDAYAMAVWVNIGGIDYYTTSAVGDSQRAPFISEIVGMGGTAVEIGKIFDNSGAGNDYVWSWTPPVPPTPPISRAAVAMDMIDREMIDDVLMEE